MLGLLDYGQATGCEDYRWLTLKSAAPVRRPMDCVLGEDFMARLEKQFESATVEWATPADIFEPLAKEFTFVLDVAANAENAKCSEFITREQNGLLSPWRGVCW